MLDGITKKFNGIIQKMSGKGKLTERNIEEGIHDIKMALLEADVNYKVVKDFINKVSEKAIGETVIRSINPTEQFVKVVHDELVSTMGAEQSPLKIKPEGVTVTMFVGLQGSGKTTSCAKLANRVKAEKRVLVVGADTYRPAAREQLRILTEKVGVDFFTGDPDDDPVAIVKKADKLIKSKAYTFVIIDTAGRLEIDEALMNELKSIKKIIKPDEILFTSDSMAGQSITGVVEKFNEELGITGIVLTKFDSDTRGGAALSVKGVTGKPIKFIGVGEKIQDFEPFHPDRIAGRILGMGDIVSLVEKAQESIDMDEAAKLEKKIKKNKFDLDDFLKQLKTMSNMGPLENLVKMIPGANNLPTNQIDDKKFRQFEAIIQSMTRREKLNYKIINGSRRRRIAKGSGTSVRDVNNLLKSFDQMQRMFSNLLRNPKKMQKMMSQAKNMNLPIG